MYTNFIKYLEDNELNELAEDLKNDVNDSELLPLVIDHLNDEEILKDLPTSVIHEMFMYYVNNK